ncbi:DUF3800 domain-containing protein [Bifidobacterium oedipodis]|uniref:ABC transporter n=1 Tax=Bifidobacterium oedipodis TaxID=2675322 RepID=A0A7Y0EPV5_9BIFI|nr:DUF3800 domain-containing protein [Bifidobacterium sp. DSM 109957]NMM94236.1 ABC transporter [Bifidobacterium sp. DSM 109957]
MKELSIFVDESGDRGGQAKYYLLSLVFHAQTNDIRNMVQQYEQSLSAANLPNVPFHSEPLLNGHKEYEYLSLQQRKKMLSMFASFVRHLPIAYASFSYKRNDFESPERLTVRMKRDLTNLLVDHLDYFQTFDDVKIYYDDGQDIVKKALDQSIGFVLSKEAVERRKTSMTDYRLEQVADYLCTLELADLKYQAGEDGNTYNKFFGGSGSFKKNWLKQVRRKQL